MPLPALTLGFSAASHLKRSLPEQISQTSGGSSRSSVAPSSTSLRKQVTWGKSTTAKNPTFPAAHRRIHSTLDYLKHRLRQIESERSVGTTSSKRRQAEVHKPLQGILKPPTAHFPEDQIDLRFDWTEFQDELTVYTTDSLTPPPLDTPSDITEDTPTDSLTSTPPDPISPCDSWDADSEYWSDEWDETPKLPNGWSSPLDYLTTSQMEAESGSEISEGIKPVQVSHQPVEKIQSPGDFVEELTSSLQYGLVVCGLGLMAFLFLACWTMLLITCGVMIASVFPVILVAYGSVVIFSRTKFSAEWLVMATLKTGGALTLGVGIALVVIVDFVGEASITLYRKLVGIAPPIAFFGALSIALFMELKTSMNAFSTRVNSTEYFSY